MLQIINLNPTENTLSGKINADTLIAVVLCDATNGSFSVNFPDAQHPRPYELVLKKIDSSSNTITFNPINNQTVDEYV